MMDFQVGERVYVQGENEFGIVVEDNGFVGYSDLGVEVEMSDGVVVEAAHPQIRRVA